MATSVDDRRFTTKAGVEAILRTSECAGKTVFELINPTVSPSKVMFYIHGGPNLCCEPYISDTENGGFRSLEGLLRHTNIILVNQRENISLDDVSRWKSNGQTDEHVVQRLMQDHGPDSQARGYLEVIRQFSEGRKYGIFAQSFGAQVLFSILHQVHGDEFCPEYLTLGSPFLGVETSHVFVSNRRAVLKSRMLDLSGFLNGNRQLLAVRQRTTTLGLAEAAWHKLALTISHPAYPVGIVEKQFHAQLESLTAANDKDFLAFFEGGTADVINFVIGSQYFTPTSNIFKATTQAIEDEEFSEWMPDESIWLKHDWQQQYNGSTILQSTSQERPIDSDLKLLVDAMNTTPTFVYFDPIDFMIPVNHFLDRQLPIIDEAAHIELREGYGHWVGHSIFGRVLGVTP